MIVFLEAFFNNPGLILPKEETSILCEDKHYCPVFQIHLLNIGFQRSKFFFKYLINTTPDFIITMKSKVRSWTQLN